MKTRWQKLILLVAGSMLFFQACHDMVVFQGQKDIPGLSWHYQDTLVFEVSIEDTLSLHKMYLDIRNSTDYRYSNLFLFLDIKFPDGNVLRDTLECVLADRRGQWTGRGFGQMRFNRFLFRDDVWFPMQGVYTFSLSQGMRDDDLYGIADAGIRIEKK